MSAPTSAVCWTWEFGKMPEPKQGHTPMPKEQHGLHVDLSLGLLGIAMLPERVDVCSSCGVLYYSGET